MPVSIPSEQTIRERPIISFNTTSELYVICIALLVGDGVRTSILFNCIVSLVGSLDEIIYQAAKL